MPVEHDSKNKIFPLRVKQVSTAKPALLLVDDSETSRKMLPWVLKEHFRVFTAESWSLGFQIFMKEQISILLLDVEMPGFTGDQIARQIRRVINRRKKSGQHIVVAYYSGSDENTIAELATATEVQGYALKSWSSPQLIEALNSLLEEHQPQ